MILQFYIEYTMVGSNKNLFFFPKLCTFSSRSPSCGMVTKHSAGEWINRATPFPIIPRLFICLVPPRSLVLIRHVHIRGRGDAFMIIHPLSPPLVMAALDTHPLRSQHLALTLLRFTVCITTLFNGLFRGAEVGGGGCGETKQGRENFQEFPVCQEQVSGHWEGLL